jgi:hypothetical protein
VPQGEGHCRIRAWLFESLFGRCCHDDYSWCWGDEL